jgi:replication factor C subunit 1
MPMLATKIVSPLTDNGTVSHSGDDSRQMLTSQAAIEEVIGYMDEYYLGKEDWDAFVELGVDTMKDELILKKIPTATKTAFTRQ